MPPLRGLLVGFAIRVRFVFRESGVNMTGVIVREPRFVDWLYDTVRDGVSFCLWLFWSMLPPHVYNFPMGRTPGGEYSPKGALYPSLGSATF
jgi:hypothetical protein